MKISVSLPDEDVEFLDAYASQRGIASRSAALHQAVRLLQGTGLAEAYEEAFADWASSSDEAAWETTIGDGLTDNAPG